MAGRKENYNAVIVAPFGRVGIVVRDDRLADASFLSERIELKAPVTVFERRICRQLRAYFSNPRISFDAPLLLGGTPFQQRVWKMLRRIPAGRVLSYGELASRLHTSPRAVGNACRANRIPIIIPCHRVVAANGAGGFMGKKSGNALRLKRWLLEHERAG